MSKLKILIAEDEEVTQKLYAISFRNEEHELRYAGNGEDALEIYNSWHPDIIILDIMMPSLNGYQTLETIRTNIKDNATTVIMATAVTDKKDIIACAKLGIQGYILKPFAAKNLAKTVLDYHYCVKK
ncbi:MAG: response regulator [Desulfobulbaceae bacterium]|nr:response regulator [Desulfobulbaceae bacterium]